MKKGFTILELLVASLLLGMLVTILTMIFNQSSIAWRTGVAGIADMDEVRENIASLQSRSDSMFVYDGRVYYEGSIWKSSGQLKTRAVPSGNDQDEQDDHMTAGISASDLSKLNTTVTLRSVGSVDTGGSGKNYIVNVKSAGPDRVFGTWDDIWSYPDDFD